LLNDDQLIGHEAEIRSSVSAVARSKRHERV
jgi:hypothetical protein